MNSLQIRSYNKVSRYYLLSNDNFKTSIMLNDCNVLDRILLNELYNLVLEKYPESIYNKQVQKLAILLNNERKLNKDKKIDNAILAKMIIKGIN